MFNPANTPHFTLSIEGVQHDFKVLAFHGDEAISTPYAFELECVSERPDLDLESLLHQSAFLSFGHSSEGIHGLIYQVGQSESGKRLTRYHLTLVPQVAYLAHRHNQRIFQHLTVPQIVAQVLQEHGILPGAYRFQLGPTVYLDRDYCVQYESDLHFIQRLCEEEGIHYHFQHSSQGHVLVFGDDQTAFATLGQPTAYVQDSGLVADEPVIKRFGVRLATRTSSVARRDYEFQYPGVKMEAAIKSEFEPALEDYDYPGHFTNRTRGRQLANRILERHRTDYELAEGLSDQPTLRSGHLLALSDHPRAQWNDLWLLTGVHHEGKQPQVLEESVTSAVDVADGFQQGYRNSFTATPWDVFYRPPIKHRKPKIVASQTAVVTGPAGEEIHCDEYGRVKVQFHWDRLDQNSDKSSCWLRVSSSWAGDSYGAIAIPRVGMEVLVTFLEGDLDRPLITGCLYHKEHPAPYALPANKTRSVFRTHSSPASTGFNELHIEDRSGQELIYLRAERDLERNVQNDSRLQVGNERSETVKGNSYSVLQAEEHHTTSGDRKTQLGADDHLSIAGSSHTRAGQAVVVQAGQEVHIKAGAHIVIDAGASLTLKGGGQHIVLGPGGILSSTPINLGGAPMPGTPANPLLPGSLAALASPPAPPPVVSAIQRSIMLAAKQQGADFCPLCEACREGFCETGDRTSFNAITPMAATSDLAQAESASLGSVEQNPAAVAASGPGKWVTRETDYHGVRNSGMLLINRVISMGDEGRVFGSDGKDYQNTKRTMIQVWQPLTANEQHLADSSAIHRYGEERRIEQTYLEGQDDWQVSGKSPASPGIGNL